MDSASASPAPKAPLVSPAIEVDKFSLWYGDFQALFDVDIDVAAGKVTSLIGPSGCGKSTLLRSVNRINERLGYVRTTGAINVMGVNVLDPEVEMTQLRRAVGMVFQRPNPLPLSIRDNALFAYRLHRGGKGPRAEEEQVVEQNMPRKKRMLRDPLKDVSDEELVYTNLPLLNRFVSESGAILPRKLTGVSERKQKLLTRAIKRARVMALMPYVWKDPKYRHASYADAYSRPEKSVKPVDGDEFADPPDIRFPGQRETSGLEVDLSSFGRISPRRPPPKSLPSNN